MSYEAVTWRPGARPPAEAVLRLVDALVNAARATGHRAVGLGVEPENPARWIYERAGLVRVADDGGARTTALDLRQS